MAAVSSTAATASMGSPTYFGSLLRIGFMGCGGTSAAVSTPSTPGIASARLVSMRVTRPCGTGLG